MDDMTSRDDAVHKIEAPLSPKSYVMMIIRGDVDAHGFAVLRGIVDQVEEALLGLKPLIETPAAEPSAEAPRRSDRKRRAKRVNGELATCEKHPNAKRYSSGACAECSAESVRKYRESKMRMIWSYPTMCPGCRRQGVRLHKSANKALAAFWVHDADPGGKPCLVRVADFRSIEEDIHYEAS